MNKEENFGRNNKVNSSTSLDEAVHELEIISRNGHLNSLQRWIRKNGQGLKRNFTGGPLVPIQITSKKGASKKKKSEIMRTTFHKSLLDITSNASLVASANGRVNVLLEFLIRGSNPRVKDSKTGRTLLHVACKAGNLTMVRFLLDSRFRDKFYIIRQQNPETRVRHGVMVSRISWDVNARDNFNRTPLMLASWSGHSQVVKLLLEANADIHQEEKKFGWTALIGAAHFMHLRVVQVLLKEEHFHDTPELSPRTARKNALMQLGRSRKHQQEEEEHCDFVNCQSKM